LTYRHEFQLIPEGETYRICLDAPAEPERAVRLGAPSAVIKTKTAIYIVSGVGTTAVAAWGVLELIESSTSPESPAKP
jgi:hypothetical protein